MRDKIYFASDFHLGMSDRLENLARERKTISWLDIIKKDAKTIYFLGDIFDFWFEYHKVIPKGFVRFLGKIAELSDSGINTYFFVGNHDMWMGDYLSDEIGIKIFYKPMIVEEYGKKIYLGHGDGLGKGDYMYKFLRLIFKSKICRWLFARLHPNFSFTIAHAWSRKSRKKNNTINSVEQINKDTLFEFCKAMQESNPIDYYIFGHTHNPIKIELKDKSKYINLGDWITHYTYAVMDKHSIKLETYK